MRGRVGGRSNVFVMLKGWCGGCRVKLKRLQTARSQVGRTKIWGSCTTRIRDWEWEQGR